MAITCCITISGLVQGVGFRPFVFNLAVSMRLTGRVYNNANGVVILISGEPSVIHEFYDTLLLTAPSVSRILDHAIVEVDATPFDSFEIVQSQADGSLTLPLTPDFAICDSCASEILHPNNRRYHYPFTTCVHCGPRWAIVDKFPFDREHTAIRDFSMCDACHGEYTKASDRRFHSQTNSCSTCGIQTALYNAEGDMLSTETQEIFKRCAAYLKQGSIIAIKNTSGFLLCCNAEDAAVIDRLRQLKKRPAKPFAVLYPGLESLKQSFDLTVEAETALRSPERPIVIISARGYRGKLAVEAIAPGLQHLGVMVPYTGILAMLAHYLKFPIIATSGNIHGSPILADAAEVFEKLSEVVDYVLDHNLKILQPQDDSVVKWSDRLQHFTMFRRSRGYAPNYLGSVKVSKSPVIAMGSDLKSSVALHTGKRVYLSQYLGNLNNYDVLCRYESCINAFRSIFEVHPSYVLVDHHPGYQSTLAGLDLAETLEANCIQIQHHKAHFAALLGEHNLFESPQPIMGVIWDGIGYGDDGHIWGGEFMTYDSGRIRRIEHLDYKPWLAGDRMSREPKVSLFAMDDGRLAEVTDMKFSETERAVLTSLKSTETLRTSSLGRLFDAMSALLGLCDINSFEGEAAMLLEAKAGQYNWDACRDYLAGTSEDLNPTEVLHSAWLDLKRGAPVSEIAANFHFTLAKAVIRIAKRHGFDTLCLSGGVFQNTTLTDMICLAAPEEFNIYLHRNMAPNDENIAFGQLMYYLYCNDTV